MKTLSPESETVSANKKRVNIIRELVQGLEAATQLKLLLQNPIQSEPSLSTEELVAKVLRSFTEAISIITSSEPGSVADVAHWNLLNSGENGSPVAGSGNDPRCGDSGESRKRSQKGGRGCYKRRKSGQTKTIVSYTTDDNHAWRKYGQKEIQNSEFARSYFRCRHKFDQGCQATKQVQRDQDHRDMYRTTYIGIHTCNATSKADPDSKVQNNEEGHQINTSSLTMKQEFPKEDTPSDVTDHDKLDDDPSMWSELKDFEPSNKIAIMPLKIEVDGDNGDDSHQGPDIYEVGVESVHFGIDFHFDESHLL